MEVLTILIPVSLFLGALGLAFFFWTMKNRQYEDPEGDARRILRSDWDDHPKP
ncbi:cbb3-type cytochrome oxidase assembly protein CcoS [Gemmobacter nectariphilus]|uniref:cbb3-type cytochrome oxidase assembly protein CcoS n=1 Tax=Gemmobacter nectariphilus TaxID=220343 RepID=UPI000405DCF9|nr:cbb3-type cytochrome oxidase assembly protein CcoS [Gemmobacter nectariphilus]